MLFLGIYCAKAARYTVTEDDIRYEVDTETGEATCTGLTSLDIVKHNIIILDNVTYQGKEYPVTVIRAYAFRGCKGSGSIVIGNNVRELEYGAFMESEDFNGTLVIGESVERIGDLASRYCTALSGIDIPNSLTAIENHTFYNCISLNNVMLPTSLTTIGDYAFNRCTGLRSIEIPENVESIGAYAFAGCPLDDIKSHNVTPSAFDDTTFSDYLASVIVPDEGYDDYAASDWQRFEDMKSVSMAGVHNSLVDSKIDVAINGRRVNIAGAADTAAIRVYNPAGVLVYYGTGDNEFTIESAGLYILKIDGVGGVYKILVR